MLGALAAVSLIANDLGARRFGTLAAVVFAASIPTGVLESTSTQNDYVVTFWLTCLYAFGLRLIQGRSRTDLWPLALGTGCALGLALLTKATAYLFALPLLVWVTVELTRKWRTQLIGPLLVAAGIALGLNAGVYVRNVEVFGSPFGPPDEGMPSLRYLNDALTPGLLASNVIRDLGVNIVATPSVPVNHRSWALVEAIHSALGIDIQDSRSTWDSELFREQPVGAAFVEDFASNPVHLLLLVLAFIGIWPLSRQLAPDVRPYALTLVAAFVLFAAVLRWQPWHTRLELPLFVLGAPLVAVVAERLHPNLALALAAVLLVGMLPWVVNNQARPLIGPRTVLGSSRADQYFTFKADLGPAYLGAVDFIAERHCNQVGFISDQDGWEYPLSALSPPGTRIEHVGVTNISADLTNAETTSFHPCAILAVGTYIHNSMTLGESVYRPAWTQDAVSVLTLDGT
jgi:hypothetical protein